MVWKLIEVMQSLIKFFQLAPTRMIKPRWFTVRRLFIEILLMDLIFTAAITRNIFATTEAARDTIGSTPDVSNVTGGLRTPLAEP